MIPYFDCHCDTIVEASLTGEGLLQNNRQLDLIRLSRFSPCAQVFAVCTVYKGFSGGKAQEYIDKLHLEIEKNGNMIALCRSQSDIDRAVSEGKIAALLSVEGAEQISSLEKSYNDGVRIIHLTWNYDNYLCGAAVDSGSGLTDEGKAFVKKAQGMGIMLDMSHLSERGFWDTLEISSKPVIAGHSNSACLCPVKRNLTDEQFCALAAQGGGAGINLYPEFIGHTRDVDAVIRHIEHFLSLGGEKAVFLGCDFDGITIMPEGINGVQDTEKLYNELLKRNYPETLVQNIFWNNLYDIIGRAL